MRFLIVLFCLIVGSVAPKNDGPAGHNCGPECPIIDHAITNYETVIADHDLCHIFDHLDCHFYIKPDEHWVCSTNGQTFTSRCEFIKAQCSFKGHDTHVLFVDHSRQCGPAPVQPHQPGPCSPEPACHEIDAAIQHIAHFEQHVCHAFENVNCTQHILPNDEKVCASDGVLYHTHCDFVKARCMYFMRQTVDPAHRIELMLLHPDQCAALLTNSPSGTHAPSTNQPTTLPYVTATSTHSLNSQSATDAQSTATPSTSQAATTSTGAVTAVPSGQTTESLLHMFESVLCSHHSQIDCTGTFDLICGSDGQFYPNKCALLKAVCFNPSLVAVDKSMCTP